MLYPRSSCSKRGTGVISTLLSLLDCSESDFNLLSLVKLISVRLLLFRLSVSSALIVGSVASSIVARLKFVKLRFLDFSAERNLS